MIEFAHKERYGFDDLVEIYRILTSPDGCPWDREQTHESVRMNFIEEVYEAVEAIDTGNSDLLREELGDVLMQVVFHAEMERRAGNFDISNVCDEVCKKLIYRHPHIFGDIKVSGSDEVLSNWEELKRREKGQETYADTLSAVASSLPALMRAEKLQKRAKKCGFDWENVDGAYDKVEEELKEVREATPENVLEEMGDLLFAVVNVSRFLKVNPEEALTFACKKFTKRFDLMEKLAKDAGHNLADLDLDGMDKFWEAAKSVEKANG
ncbi:MAG: nucleoside triphosphate pyrophosphohydrolase [Clostridia bacterium]|nr:nucleoside triphosphate pyrophosphohydrolase [Clostridia bacterium]